MDFGNRMTWLFSSIIGMIIGSGYFIQAFILGLLVYLIIRNSDHVLNYIHKIPSEEKETEIENSSN